MERWFPGVLNLSLCEYFEGASALVTLPGETDAVRYEAGDYEFRR